MELREMNVKMELKNARMNCNSKSCENVANRFSKEFISEHFEFHDRMRNAPNGDFIIVLMPYFYFDAFVEDIIIYRKLFHYFVLSNRDTYDSERKIVTTFTWNVCRIGQKKPRKDI